MALSDEQIEKLTGASRTRASMWLVVSSISRAIEAEVRKEDSQLISDLLSALEYHAEQTRPIPSTTTAIQASRTWLRNFR